jgi:hypothetical protein
MTGDDQYVDVELTDNQLADLELLARRFGVSPEQYVEVAIDKIVAELDGQSLAPPEQVVKLTLNKAENRIVAELNKVVAENRRSLDPLD